MINMYQVPTLVLGDFILLILAYTEHYWLLITLHRGRKGIFDSFSKIIFESSVFNDKRTQILYQNDYIW